LNQNWRRLMKMTLSTWLGVALVLSIRIDTYAQSERKRSDAVPSLEETLAWLKRLPPVESAPAGTFAAMSVEGLQAMTTFRYGGHTAAGPHVATPAAEFRFLRALPALRKLDLVENDGVDDEAAAHIGKIATLTDLDFGGGGGRVTAAGMKSLTTLKDLVSLGMAGNLSKTKGDLDSCLPYVAKLPKLETLVLSNTPVTDAGLSYLARCSSLKEVRLAMTGVSDAGLLNLASLKSLTQVVLDKKTKVTPQGIQRFEKLLPGCKVVVH
jgi:hypothetical protein